MALHRQPTMALDPAAQRSHPAYSSSTIESSPPVPCTRDSAQLPILDESIEFAVGKRKQIISSSHHGVNRKHWEAKHTYR